MDIAWSIGCLAPSSKAIHKLVLPRLGSFEHNKAHSSSLVFHPPRGSFHYSVPRQLVSVDAGSSGHFFPLAGFAVTAFYKHDTRKAPANPPLDSCRSNTPPLSDSLYLIADLFHNLNTEELVHRLSYNQSRLASLQTTRVSRMVVTTRPLSCRNSK